MSRIPMVTRTYKKLVCTVTAVDTQKKEFITLIIEVPDRTYTERKFHQLIQKQLSEKGSLSLLTVDEVKQETSLIGMTEETFLKLAKKIEN